MKYKVTISRTHLKQQAYAKAKGRKVRNSGDDGNIAIINRLFYNFLLKERESK